MQLLTKHFVGRLRAPYRPRGRWLVPLLWMALIFWFSSQPTLPSVPEHTVDAILKKVAHFLLYAVLCRLWMWALSDGEEKWGETARVALTITVLYAISDEIHQRFVPGRGPRVTDVVIDSLGALTAIWWKSKGGRILALLGFPYFQHNRPE